MKTTGQQLSSKTSLWLLASIMVGFLAASSAPSPLYAIYRQAWGFSALTLTVVFSVYAFALLSALLVFGSLSDFRGRRDIILLALGLEVGSLLLFLNADSVASLIAARALQGLATGIVTSALSAALIDIDRTHGALVNSVAPMIGMGIGALGTSLLVQFAPAPTKIVFELLIVVFIVQAAAMWFLPETVSRRPGVWRSLWPSIAIPQQARATLWQVLPVNTALWALGGFSLSLGPSLARIVTASQSPLVGGFAIAALVLTSAAAILVVRTHPPRAVLIGGTIALATGMVVTLAGIASYSAAAYFIGTAIMGAGFGAGFNGSLRSLVGLARPEQRGDLMAGFFSLSYLAFSVPAILAGLAVGYFGLYATALGFLAGIMALALIALALMTRKTPGVPAR
ncbi:MFS transporter [Duganella dendranthematis]|uniref:MFS transporter n=1 Tax=Duganella dendranthematis TaxID=2728021 RepID=A0ABX6M4B7_9BURK|nr:MFS transporter [Duganella dendranthematis]QJD89111.1 MFS transporter [Duganella dendranthematis]